ncbi:MAG: oleate hydratase [Candidatus Helarchaeota archaeon]|nr:oleate hydratase [Candidatus Helarchaeota archaeon]
MKTTEKTQVYVVGGGIAGLAAAAFAVRDAKVAGSNVHIFEVMDIAGGALDGIGTPEKYVARGARKYNYPAYNCTWNLFESIPSITNPELVVMDEILKFNEENPKNVKTRIVGKNQTPVIVKRQARIDMPKIDQDSLVKFWLLPEDEMDGKKISDFFRPEFFQTNMWHVFASMFGFETWHSAIECKRYFLRFAHEFGRTKPEEAEVSTTFNQYDSQILPLVTWLKSQGVDFNMGCRVNDMDFKAVKDEITVSKIHYTKAGEEKEITITDDDIVLVTNGSMVADSRAGSMDDPAPVEMGKLDGSWKLWENMITSLKNARQTAGALRSEEPVEFGDPAVFCGNIEKTKWIVFSVTGKDDRFIKLYEKFTGNADGDADLVTFKDSNWYMSVHVPKQPQFPDQPDDVIFWMGYGLIQDKEGDYVKKKMPDCNGKEILTEVCKQFGFDEDLPHILENSTCIPNMMPYDTAHFMPRKHSDRPLVVPPGSTNLAFIGQFVEIPEECVFLVETSIRSAMTGIYTLLNVDKEIPPIYKSKNIF